MSAFTISRRAFLGATGLGVAGLAVAGCGGGGGGSSSAAFSYQLPDEYFQWLNDDKWYSPLCSAAGADLKLVNGGPRANYYQKIDLALTSNSIKDAAIVDLAQVAVYGPQGAFLDLKPLIDKHAPNIKKYLSTNSQFAKLITFGGKIYGIVAEYPRISSVTFYRADMFKKAGITTPPRTIAALTEALRKLKKAYKTTANYYPLLGRDQFFNLQYAFNAQDRIDADNKVHGIYTGGLGQDIYSPGFKEMLQWYRQLYSEELIDPEFVAGTISEDAWQTKYLTGKGAVSTDFFTRPSWFINSGGKASDPDYAVSVLPAFADEHGNQLKVAANQQFQTEQCLVISANSKNATDIIKFVDFTFSPKGQMLMHYGVRGKSYTMRGGKPEYLVTSTKESNQPVGTPVWNFDQDRLTFPAPVDDEAYYQWWGTDAETRSFDLTYFDKYTYREPVLRYSPGQLKERTSLDADLEPFIAAQAVQFVTGKQDFSKWNDFLGQATKKGAKRITAIDQAAYDAMY